MSPESLSQLIATAGERLTPTDKSTGCPYKGFASYWTVTIDGTEHPDIVWSYPTPLEEATRVAGHWCFDGPNVEVSRVDD